MGPLVSGHWAGKRARRRKHAHTPKATGWAEGAAPRSRQRDKEKTRGSISIRDMSFKVTVVEVAGSCPTTSDERDELFRQQLGLGEYLMSNKRELGGVQVAAHRQKAS